MQTVTTTVSPSASLEESDNKALSQQEEQEELQTESPPSQSVSPSPSPETKAIMKLVVRSPYWGRILKGKTRMVSHDVNGVSGRRYRVIGCQAVLSAIEGQYWGCCPHHGKRVLELKECHFLDHHAGNWDLYMVGSSVAPSYVIHAFFMVPQNQTVIDIGYKMTAECWNYVGTANASMIRMDLEAMLAPILKQNEGMGYQYHHVHMEILMDQVLDRETPRSRKAAIEKSRSERSSSSSVVTPQSNPSMADGSSATTTPVPPIPNVVSNDTSWFPEAAYQSNHGGMMNMSRPAGWAPDSAQQQHFHPHHAYHPSWTNIHQPVQWYPAAMAMYGAGPVILPPMNQGTNSAQQMLMHGYTTAGAVLLGSSSTSHAAMPHSHHTPTVGVTNVTNQHSQADLSFSDIMGQFSNLKFPEGSNSSGGESHNVVRTGNDDEKFNEDVATASFSETSQEEEEEDENHNSNCAVTRESIQAKDLSNRS